MSGWHLALSVGLALFGCIGVPAGVIAFVAGAFWWTTGPILKAAREANAPRTFFLTDLIWLLLQVQLAMGVAATAFPAGIAPSLRWAALVVLSIAMLFFWLAGLQAVSRAGIRRPLRRAMVFIVLLPGLALTALGVPLLTLALFQALSDQGPGGLPVHGALVVGGQLLLLIAFSLSLHWLARWAVTDR